MDYISTSPVLTSILTFLSCRELAACSEVSRKFFDVIERNRGVMSKWRINLCIDSVSNVFLIVGSSKQDDSCKWTIVIYEKKISVQDDVGVLGFLPGIANVIARKRATCKYYKRNSYNNEIEFEASGKAEEFSEVMRIIRDRFKLVNLQLIGIPLTSSQMNSVIPLVRGIHMNALEFRTSLDNVAMQLYRASDVATVKMWILELNKKVIIRDTDVTSKQLNDENFFQLDSARSNIEVVGGELILSAIERIIQEWTESEKKIQSIKFSLLRMKTKVTELENLLMSSENLTVQILESSNFKTKFRLKRCSDYDKLLDVHWEWSSHGDYEHHSGILKLWNPENRS